SLPAVAVPLAVAKSTVTVADGLAGTRLTVNVAVPAPSFTLTLLIDRVLAASSLVIVPVPVAVAIVALVGADRVTVNVSFGSNVVSPLTLTVMVLDVCPGVKVSVPLVAV